MAAPDLKPVDEVAVEAAAWAAFVQRLGDHLAGQWPAMRDRLTGRYDAFVELAVQQAGERGFTHAASVARFANLWFVWGPAFHEKPGFEWAQGILAAPREREWLIVHQLVRRSLVELERLPGARIEPQALAAADARVIDTFGPLGRKGAMRLAEPEALPRAACDLEAAELRVLDDAAPLEYRLVEGGEWQRVAAATPVPLRVDAARPMPARVAVLSHQGGQGAKTRLQARLRAHVTCSGDVHPAVDFLGPHGKWRWIGHETRAVSWPVATRDQPPPRPGAGAVIAEETSPELQRLVWETCGLRDEGDALGVLATTVAVLPAEQWWMELQRAAPTAQTVLPGPRPWARGTTRARLERDGASQDPAALARHFEHGLDGELAVGVQSLAAAWERVPGLVSPSLDATLGVLGGRFSATWGWRLGDARLDAPALLRLLALFEMQACEAEMQFGGELVQGDLRSRIVLRVAGKAPLRHELRHEGAVPPLAERMAAAQAQWRMPFTLALDPLAAADPGLIQAAGPVTGALVGEAGLRPCTTGSSGWEWFARLRVEPVAVPLQVSDPLLGDVQRIQSLLPAMTLLDWKSG